MKLSLLGRRAFVGGSSKGIGKAIAEELAHQGASVTLFARTAHTLDEVRAALDVGAGQTHSCIVGDVSSPNTWLPAVEKHVEKHDGFHIVVNNTGGPAGGQLRDTSSESIAQAFHDHVLVAHRLMLITVPLMHKLGYGRIINIISTSVKQPIEGLGVSNTVRGAMASWAKTLATELGGGGITVNNVLPGATATDRLEQIIDRKATSRDEGRDFIVNELLSEIPAGRFAEPREIANAVAFLASEAAGYINGTSILVDGGRTRALS